MVDLGQKKVELSAFFYALNLRIVTSPFNVAKKPSLKERDSLYILNQIFLLITDVHYIMLPPYSN